MPSSIDYSATGTVFNMQRYSIHDGPGIRTIVFLKGCPLSCLWCCNPESQNLKPEVMYQASLCIHCGKCIKACKFGAIEPQNIGLVNHTECVACGECVNVCPTSALTMKGQRLTVEQVIQELKRDEINYRRSGGGITLSGGEPLLQSGFAVELLKACHAKGWHTAIETTAYATGESIDKVFPYIDLALLDIKSLNNEIHQKVTGVSNEIILKNAKRISELTETVVRVPTIPGVNASPDGIRAICEFVLTLHQVKTLHLLPYHTYGENKYELLGRKYQMEEKLSLSEEEVAHLKEIVEGYGLNCVIGG